MQHPVNVTMSHVNRSALYSMENLYQEPSEILHNHIPNTTELHQIKYKERH